MISLSTILGIKSNMKNEFLTSNLQIERGYIYKTKYAVSISFRDV